MVVTRNLRDSDLFDPFPPAGRVASYQRGETF
jgi:hypothetical protein